MGNNLLPVSIWPLKPAPIPIYKFGLILPTGLGLHFSISPLILRSTKEVFESDKQIAIDFFPFTVVTIHKYNGNK